MSSIVICRPEPGATSTRERADEMGLSTITVPLFEVEAIDWKAPDPSGFDGLLLTSANVAGFAGPELEKLRSLPVYAVGPKTADSARDAGLTVAETGDQGVKKLLSSIDHRLRLLHLTAEQRVDYRLMWQKITQLVVYRSKIIEDVDASRFDGNVVLIHSPRAGERLSKLAKDRKTISIAAISKSAAAACGGGWNSIGAVGRPDDNALLALAARLCENKAT